MFQVGQLVVCVDDLSHNATRGETAPRVGTVYTVRESFMHTIYDTPSLRLVEIVNKPLSYVSGFVECCFNAAAFRPVDSQRIEVFTSLLVTPPKEDVSA